MGEGAHVKSNKECISKAAFAKVNLGIDCKGESAVSSNRSKTCFKSFPPWLIKHRKRLFFKLKFAEMGIYWCMKTNSPNLRIFSKSIWHLKIKISCFCLHLRHKRWRIPCYLAIWGVGEGDIYLHNPQTKGGLTAQESSEHSRPLWPRQLSGISRNPGILPHLPFPAPRLRTSTTS